MTEEERQQEIDDFLDGLRLFAAEPDLATDAEVTAIEEALGVSENLKSKHRAPLSGPLVATISKACAARFKAQHKKVIAACQHLEAAFDDGNAPDSMPGSLVHGLTGALAGAAAATDAFNRAYVQATQLAYDIGATEAEIALKVDNAGEWTPDGHGLAAELDKTTLERLDNAIAEALGAEGATFASLIAAVKEVFDEAIAERAEMVGLTEISDAWNSGANDTGLTAVDSGASIEKAWITEDNPCDDCAANEAEGFIDFEDEFSSGDDQPPAHPNCQCSLEMRTAKE